MHWVPPIGHTIKTPKAIIECKIKATYLDALGKSTKDKEVVIH